MSSTSEPTVKDLVNVLYQAALVGGLTIGYAKLIQMVFKGPMPKFDWSARDGAMIVLDFAFAIATTKMLIKQGLLPSDIA